MTPLQILERTFAAIRPQSSRPGNSGVYLLIDGGEVVYVGASRNVPSRVGGWSALTEEGRRTVFAWDRALWMSLPWSVATTYEYALIRALSPKRNKREVSGKEHDAEILFGLGLRDSLDVGDVAWEPVSIHHAPLSRSPIPNPEPLSARDVRAVRADDKCVAAQEDS